MKIIEFKDTIIGKDFFISTSPWSDYYIIDHRIYFVWHYFDITKNILNHFIAIGGREGISL